MLLIDKLKTLQRRRSAEDEQMMRKHLQEGDLISAEVQNIFSDGSLSLHTRSLKYGKVISNQSYGSSNNLVLCEKLILDFDNFKMLTSPSLKFLFLYTVVSGKCDVDW